MGFVKQNLTLESRIKLQLTGKISLKLDSNLSLLLEYGHYWCSFGPWILGYRVQYVNFSYCSEKKNKRKHKQYIRCYKCLPEDQLIYISTWFLFMLRKLLFTSLNRVHCIQIGFVLFIFVWKSKTYHLIKNKSIKSL